MKAKFAVAAAIAISTTNSVCIAFQLNISPLQRPPQVNQLSSGNRHVTFVRQTTTEARRKLYNVLRSAPPQSSSSASSFLSDKEHESVSKRHASASRRSVAKVGTNDITVQNSRGGRTVDEIRNELSSGKILKTVPDKNGSVDVVDFGSVKNVQSKAEVALSQARAAYMSKLDHTLNGASENVCGPPGPEDIMGINEEVLGELGHPIGTYVEGDDVQRCGAWLRSTAASSGVSMKPLPGDEGITFTDAEVMKFKSLLNLAYDESGEITGAFAKTFYLGTQLMDEKAKRAIWAVYVWCRRTDEIVDAPRDSDDEMLEDLSAWEYRLERLWEYGEVVDVLDLPLLDLRINYPKMPIEPFMDMVRGMLMDIPGLGQDRYDTFEELHLYCYRVAGTVGLMSMPVFGCAPGFTEEDAKEPALSLGVAFQLTNILRDVGEDSERGRVYLPKEDLDRFGVTEDQIFEKRVDDNYREMMKFQINRARKYYEKAQLGVPMLAPSSRWPVQSSLDCYGEILDRIEENNYDSLTQRAYVSKFEKLCILPLSWYRTTDVAKFFPIPGDEAKI